VLQGGESRCEAVEAAQFLLFNIFIPSGYLIQIMIIGILKLELFLPVPNSLKAKRAILKKVINRLRNTFNISVSELDYQDLWQRSVIGVSIIGSEKRYLNGVMDKVVDFVETVDDVQLLNYSLEFI